MNMFSYNLSIFENRSWQLLKSWSRPFTDGTTLDDTLDAGAITLSLSRRQEPIKPFTRLRIIVSEDGTECGRIYRLVATSKRTRRVFAPSLTPLYDWQIQTIEVTKEMERRFIGTMTVTKYLSKEYNAKGIVSFPAIAGTPFTDGYLNKKNNVIGTAKIGQEFVIPPFSWLESIPEGLWEKEAVGNLQPLSWGDCTITLTSPSGNVVFENTGAPSISRKVTLSQAGTYILQYKGKIGQGLLGVGSGIVYLDYTAIYRISAYEQIVEKKEEHTITNVCERLLSAGITRRVLVEDQEYELDPVFAAKYKYEPSPEFSFSNCTLFDALAQVGGKIHAIPRLIPKYVRDNPTLDKSKTIDDTHYYVTFDELGGDEQAPNMPPMIYQDHTINIDDWCGTLDSPSQNMCNTENVELGAITELGNDYITCRTEDAQIEINADNVIIRTSMPIQQLVKLECGFIPEYFNGQVPVGDITSYVYESAEYSTLSSYWGAAYPYSKAWALKYTQGDNKITGLNTIQQGATTVSSAFNKYSIVNIIEAKTGIEIGLIDADNGKWIRQLAFKVTYVPIVSARVKQMKPTMSGANEKNELVYNQGANVAETSFYGEKMRGAIARLGQDVEQRTYDLFHYSQMPKCGQLLDGKYIARVDAEYDLVKIRVTLTMTKNFNQLAQYVGLNSNYRLYDISEKQSVERYINYSEKILIGDKTDIDMTDYVMCRELETMIKETVSPMDVRTSLGKPTQIAVVKPYDELNNLIIDRNVVLPVVAFPFGTSVCFAISFEDNYGAGFQSRDDFGQGSTKAVQRLVPYTDAYGEIHSLEIIMGKEGWSPSLDTQKDGGAAMLYPQATINEPYWITHDTQWRRVIVQKDSREKLRFMYQLHFIGTRDSIVVGTGMATYNLFANKSNNDSFNAGTVVLWLGKNINALNKYIDAEDSVLGSEMFKPGTATVSPLGKDENGTVYWKARKNPTSATAKSYAVCRYAPGLDGTVDETSKLELLFGENFENGLAPNELAPPIYFSPAANMAYAVESASWHVKSGAIAYKDSALTIPLGKYVSTKSISQDNIHADYAKVANATLNKNGYVNQEFFQHNIPVILDYFTLQYDYEEGTLKLDREVLGGKFEELTENVDYTVSGKTITLTNKDMLVLGVRATYKCISDTKIETRDTYASPDDLEFM